MFILAIPTIFKGITGNIIVDRTCLTGTILIIDTGTGTGHITVDIRYENLTRSTGLLRARGPTSAAIGEF